MALRVRWSKEAEETFDAVIEYLENKWSEKEIRNFVRTSHKVIEQIEKNPFQFKASGFHSFRKAFVSKHNSLLYGVNEEDEVIELYTFWDNRQNPDKLQY
ncbi:MAG: type II toxin-antitoxin system RelE/ParE family toxin [Salinivirgaceae bacterium]|nr:type II toxin-antitoxin system RelE/ParE family toxin [Salinivirgaceae bacterium]